jgi:predicted alpha/beta-fold hydrolase
MEAFSTTPRLRGGHRMTLFTWARPRSFPHLPAPVPRLFDVAADARVMAECHWQEAAREQPTLLLLHGLEGSSRAHYMRGMADKAFAAGMNVVRLNQRNCGGTEHLSVGLYHSGMTEDPAAVIRELAEVDGLSSIAVAGYSLGGNLALKLAGDYGNTPPRVLTSIVAVSPTLELAVCVDALERRENVLYERNFVRNLKRRMRLKARLFPGVYQVNDLRHVRTVRQFDELFTAPYHGFRDATDYYQRASAMRVVSRIRVPTLIITAEDDPFVPVMPFSSDELVRNPHIELVMTRHGGHCGFVSNAALANDGYWAESKVVQFALRHASTAGDRGQRIPARSEGVSVPLSAR